ADKQRSLATRSSRLSGSGRTFNLQARVADPTLRLGQTVFFAPVTRRFERGGERRIAAGAERLGYLVLATPILVGAGLYAGAWGRGTAGGCGSRCGGGCRSLGRWRGLPVLVAGGESDGNEGRECQSGDRCMAHGDLPFTAVCRPPGC